MSKYIELEDAINKIVNTPTKVITDDLTALADRQHEIIDMLSDLPTIEVGEDALKGCDKVDKRSSEDAISRNYILSFLDGEVMGDDDYIAGMNDEQREIREVVRNAPSVIPKPKEGEWIYIDEPIIGNPYGRYRCSECELEEPHKTNYCPNCGAKMKGVE